LYQSKGIRVSDEEIFSKLIRLIDCILEFNYATLRLEPIDPIKKLAMQEFLETKLSTLCFSLNVQKHKSASIPDA
jgi:hypothetical protein